MLAFFYAFLIIVLLYYDATQTKRKYIHIEEPSK